MALTPNLLSRFQTTASCVALLCAGMDLTWAEVKLPNVISDHMVLQCDRPARIWGWADPGETITVSFIDRETKATADENGDWEVMLPAGKPGGPHTITIAGKSNILTVEDILIGEVWVCSGQSNMEWRLVASRKGDEAIRTSDLPQIRLFRVPHRQSDEPQRDVEAEWRLSSPKTTGWFSAVGFYFGRELHRELDVPVGLVMSTLSGSRIEPWTPAVGVEAIPELAGIDKPVNGTLYNGMIHPLTPFTIRGAIWYQGEGNLDDGPIYYHRMRALINGWRRAWDQGDFPFYYVQLSPLKWGPGSRPGTALPTIWEAQTRALTIPNTGMAITHDIGNVGDPHPRNKLDVGKRLARWAFAKTYARENVIYSGPIYKSMEVEDGRIRIHFDHAQGGLKSRDGKPLTWFTIAGDDGEFVPATAEIADDGQSILVWNDDLKHPTAVRFAWHQTAEPNLMNGAGLPASAFRTNPPFEVPERVDGGVNRP